MLWCQFPKMFLFVCRSFFPRQLRDSGVVHLITTCKWMLFSDIHHIVISMWLCGCRCGCRQDWYNVNAHIVACLTSLLWLLSSSLAGPVPRDDSFFLRRKLGRLPVFCSDCFFITAVRISSWRSLCPLFSQLLTPSTRRRSLLNRKSRFLLRTQPYPQNFF